MFYDFAFTIPAGTLERSPATQRLKLTHGVIHTVRLFFPPGPKGLVSVVVNHGGHQLYPTNPQGQYNAEDVYIAFDDFYPLFAAPYELVARGWSPDAIYAHTITIEIGLLQSKFALAMLRVAAALERFLEFLGLGVPTSLEELVGLPPPLPAPEEAPPPPPTEEAPPPPAEEAPPPPPEEGLIQSKILAIEWYDGAAWHGITEPMPEQSEVRHRALVHNQDVVPGFYYVEFTPTGQYYTAWVTWRVGTVNPGEQVYGYADLRTRGPGSWSCTFRLLANGREVDAMTRTVTVRRRTY